jgi:hypothetical protein
MPVYSVRLRVNVPAVGETQPLFTSVTAASIEQAIQIARAMVVIEPIAVQKTADDA